MSLPLIYRKNKQSPSKKNNKSAMSSYISEQMYSSMVQKRTRQALMNKRMLYIDFKLQNSLTDLKPTHQQYIFTPKLSQIETDVADKYCEGDKLRVSDNMQQVDKFQNKWKMLLQQRKLRETKLCFHNVKTNINPQSLQEYLQRKRNEEAWKIVAEREQQLRMNDILMRDDLRKKKSNSLPRNRHQRYEIEDEFKYKKKFRTFQKLNKLLKQ